MQLYADEDFPRAVVEELRRLGHDVLTVQDDGHRLGVHGTVGLGTAGQNVSVEGSAHSPRPA
jgi:hypothetical protein